MTKKTVGYVHMLWTCPRCTTRNPGPQKFCNGCGAPQPKDAAFEQAPEEKLLTDAAEIARAKAGPDVHCPYCNARNSGDAKFCGACGGDLSGSQARESGKVAGAFRSGPAAPIVCARCGTSNPGASLKCANCGASLAPAASEIQPATPASTARPVGRSPIMIVGIVAAALCGLAVICFLIFASRKTEQVGQVASVGWERRVAIEALRLAEREDWRDQVPTEAELGACRQEQRTTSQEPVANSIEVCGTPYTVDTGSGYGEVVQDCVYEVYDDRCTYTIPEWTVVDTAVASGTGNAPAWPVMSLSSDERPGEQTQTYSVVFVTGNDSYTYTPQDEAEYAAYVPGSRWLLVLNGLGAITSIEPAP